MRVVIDMNVLISAIFWTGKPKRLLNRVRQQEITFIPSSDLLNELREILIRRDKPFHLSNNEADQIVETIRGLAEVVKIHSRIAVCHDEMDNHVLSCARYAPVRAWIFQRNKNSHRFRFFEPSQADPINLKDPINLITQSLN